jgi:carboxylesterase type B
MFSDFPQFFCGVSRGVFRCPFGTVNAYWINFAKNGNPNGPGLPNWPAYKTDSDQLMNFTNDGPKAMADPLKTRLDVAESKAK